MDPPSYQGGYSPTPYTSPRPAPYFPPPTVFPPPAVEPEPVYVVEDDTEFKSKVVSRTGTAVGLGIAAVVLIVIVLLVVMISSFKIKKHVKPTHAPVT